MQVALGLARPTLNDIIIRLVAINNIHQTSTYIMHATTPNVFISSEQCVQIKT